jgi:hypothetical protein
MTSQSSSVSPRRRREPDSTLQPVEVRMILIAGADLASMREASMQLFREGHISVMGEWFSEPLVSLSGLDRADEETFHKILQPLSARLLSRCDAVLRVGGPSSSGDAIVGLARSRGLRVFFSLKEALDG